ncbi:MAG: rRNA adenine dimethyltransferase family protein [Actinomycetota bacterium]
MGSRSRPSHGRSSSPWLGQHFLKSPDLAATLVQRAELAASDLVVEMGAGSGMLTEELARSGAKVMAVELDGRLATTLAARFRTRANVLVIIGDFFELPPAADPFRVFGSIPFGATTRTLRHLLNGTTSMRRADLIVQRGVAIKRARRRNLLNATWGPWWRFEMGKRIPARCFSPPPSVDAAMLVINKRKSPLLPAGDKRDFARFVGKAFRAADLRRAMTPYVSSRRLRRVLQALELPPDARPHELDVSQLVELFKTARERT